jgi:hypothetical protein
MFDKFSVDENVYLVTSSPEDCSSDNDEGGDYDGDYFSRFNDNL